MACGGPGKSIGVSQEIFFPDVKPRVDSISRTHGGFVVAGTGVAAWVVATDEQGKLLWRYDDPIEDKNQTVLKSGPQSEFHGAVPLTNGNTLLCGGQNRGGRTDNLLAILDHTGRLVERRAEMPNGDSRFIYSNFYQCFPWQDGILLLGNTNDGTHGYIWLVELDGNGATRRQAFVDNVPTATEGSVAGPSFVFTAWDSQDNFRIIRANEKGETLAKRVIAGESIMQLRSVVATGRTSILTDRAGKTTLYVLDQRLQDVQPPKAIKGYFDPQAGRGYVLGDGSILLFGRRSNATLSLMSEQGETLATREFDPKYTSFAVSDAVPISAGEFVTVRGSMSQDPKDQGLVISWVTIKDGPS